MPKRLTFAHVRFLLRPATAASRKLQIDQLYSLLPCSSVRFAKFFRRQGWNAIELWEDWCISIWIRKQWCVLLHYSSHSSQTILLLICADTEACVILLNEDMAAARTARAEGKAWGRCVERNQSCKWLWAMWGLLVLLIYAYVGILKEIEGWHVAKLLCSVRKQIWETYHGNEMYAAPVHARFE